MAVLAVTGAFIQAGVDAEEVRVESAGAAQRDAELVAGRDDGIEAVITMPCRAV